MSEKARRDRYLLRTTMAHIGAIEHARMEAAMNTYHDGWKARWFKRMVDAGWRFWIWQDSSIMWRHSDEPTTISVDAAHDYFLQFVNTDGAYIPDPYEVQEAQR